MNRDTSAVVGWRISSYSSDTGRNCVEAGPFLNEPQRFAVRDSTQRDLGFLSFPSSEWAALLCASSR
ncbi:DUF397 domain-containing protein [Nocardiopsis terrae]